MRPKTKKWTLAAVSAGLLATALQSCGGSEPSGPDPLDAVASVTVSPPTATVDIGSTTQLMATVRNGRNEVMPNTVTWSSSDSDVASVTSDGLVQGKAEGPATVSARASGITGTAAITVNDPFPPQDPSDVQASPVSDTEVDVSWVDGSTNEDEFVVEREVVEDAAQTDAPRAAAAFQEAGRVDADVTTFRDTGLDPTTTYRYRVTACNENGCSATATGSDGSDQTTTYETLEIQEPELPTAVVGRAYSAQFAATGGSGDPTWSVTAGTLPAGVSLSSSGALSGTPTEAGTFDVTIQAQGAGQTPTVDVTLEVVEHLPPAVTTEALPAGGVGAPYAAQLEAEEGDGSFSWEVTDGDLPDGLDLAGGSGAVTGTPTAAGTFDFAVQVASAGLTGEKDLSILVHEALEVTGGSLPDAGEGAPYSAEIETSGGDGSNDFQLTDGELPPGLALNASSGVISGIPTPGPSAAPGPQAVLGTFEFTVTVTNELGQTATADLSIEVVEPDLTVATLTLPDGTMGSAYSQALAAVGGVGAHHWSMVSGELPDGLFLDPETGELSGVASAIGTFDFTVRVQDDADGEDDQDLTVVVGEPTEPVILLDVPASAEPGDTPDVFLVIHLGPSDRTPGAVGIELAWDPDELEARGWADFYSPYPWYGLQDTDEAWVRVVVADTEGLPGTGPLILIPLRVVGDDGIDAEVTATLIQLVEAGTFDDFTEEMNAVSTVLRIREGGQ